MSTHLFFRWDARDWWFRLHGREVTLTISTASAQKCVGALSAGSTYQNRAIHQTVRNPTVETVLGTICYQNPVSPGWPNKNRNTLKDKWIPRISFLLRILPGLAHEVLDVEDTSIFVPRSALRQHGLIELLSGDGHFSSCRLLRAGQSISQRRSCRLHSRCNRYVFRL